MNFSDVTRANLSHQVLKVATLKAVVELFTQRYEDARKETEQALKLGGVKKIGIRLPDGDEVGEVVVTQPSPTVTVNEDALVAYVAEHQPDEVEEYLDSAALLDQELIAYCREHRDDLLKKRVRPVWRKEIVKQVTANDGYAIDEKTGDSVQVATVTKNKPTGAFALSKDPHGARSIRLMSALLAGDLGDVVELPAPPVQELPTGGFYEATR